MNINTRGPNGPSGVNIQGTLGLPWVNYYVPGILGERSGCLMIIKCLSEVTLLAATEVQRHDIIFFYFRRAVSHTLCDIFPGREKRVISLILS